MVHPRSILAFVALVIPSLAGASDPASAGAVSGRVVDAVSAEAIEGATIVAGAGSGEIAVSDADGGFVIAVPSRPIELSVYADGYLSASKRITTAESATIDIALTASRDTEVIEITGEAPELAEQTIYKLDQSQVRGLPGAGNDILRAVQSLPGVARISYGLGGLVLRGTAPTETVVYLDGIEVPIAFHFGGLSSFYPSALLADMSVTPGGGDVSRGRDVGGVVDLRSRTPRADRWRIGGELGLMDASSYAEGPAGGGGISFGLRRSYVDAILAAAVDERDLVLPHYYDGQLRWDRELGGGTLSALFFFSDDRIRFVEEKGVFQNSFARAALRYRRRAGTTTVTATPWIGLTAFALSTSSVDDSKLEMRHVPFGARSDVVHDTTWGHVAAGIDMQGSRSRLDRPLYEDPGYDAGQIYEHAVRWHGDAAVWGEARWRLDEGKLTLKPGVRLGYYQLSGAWVAEPRIVVTHELADWCTLRETFGLHHKPPGAYARAPFPDPKHSIQASVGADLELPVGARASITAYHVELDGTQTASPLSFQAELDDLGYALTTFGFGGLGVVAANIIGDELGIGGRRRRSDGIEVSLQRRGDRSFYDLSYTLSRTESALDGWWYPSILDQTHNLNAVASWQVGRWQLGARFRYTTGFPATRFLARDDDEPGPTDAERGAPRTAPFTSLDLRVERGWHRAWGTTSFFLDVQNVTNARNEEATISTDDGDSTVPGLPIFPMVGVSFAPP